jgi:hypothetical protein
VIRTESSGGWQNRDCSIALPYVCKKKPNATAESTPPGERRSGHRAGVRLQGHGQDGSASPLVPSMAQGGSDPLYSYLLVQLKSEQIRMCH